MKWINGLSKKQVAVLALILVNIIWGAASPIFKWALEDISLFQLAFFRFFFASWLLLPLTWNRHIRIDRTHWLPLLGLGISGITVNIIFFFLGLKNAPSIDAPIIASSGPILLILASAVWLREKPKTKTIIGTGIGLLGVFLIIARPLLEAGFAVSAVAGNLFFLIATVGAVAHTLIAKKLAGFYHAATLTFWSFLIGSLTFFPFFVWETVAQGGIGPLDIRGITGLVFGIFLSSTLAYSLFQWAITQIRASEVGVFTYIDPVVATIIAIPLLGEIITPLFILGSFFVFAGIFVAEGRIHYHPLHRLKIK